ncbi:unnamed protein product [Triticum aestivum]|uniref:(bread wheat) hypothetical protein n=1 Tax=Triticum aestivum TaxID=4565 RepID=A0A7G2IJW4_WHEAT|nr:unnamed protein product [Triticum aestivum]
MAAPKFFNISPYSFDPPLHNSHASTPSPDWVLLDTKAYIADRRNGTTATALASNGEAVEVTFWIADPPALSHFSVHCKELFDMAEEPRVICSDKKVAILCLHWISSKFGRCKVLRDYFVYTARSLNKAPSLMRLPNPSPRVFNPREMGLLPTVDGEGFVIAVVRPQLIIPGRYDLHLFISKNWRWSTKSAQLDPQLVARSNIDKHKTDKVIPLMEEGSLGWVDLCRGILLCNVLDDNPNPVLRFIPLPKEAAINRDIKNCPWLYRDVTYINGLIKFVAMKTWESSTLTSKRTCGSSDDITDMQFDSDLELDDDNMYVMDDTFSWNAVAWVRKTSQEAWTCNCDVSVDDIAIDNIRHLPPLNKLRISAPTLSIHGDDAVIYLTSKLNIDDDNAWVLTVNMTRKTLEDVVMFSAKRFFLFNITYRPCSLSKHLDMTADNCEAGIQIKGDDSEYDAEDRTILVDRLDPCITEDQLKCIFTQSGELGHVQMLVHQQRALIKFIHRCSAENAICEYNGFLIGRNHIRISWKCDTSDGLQGDVQSYHVHPQFSGVYSCNPTLEGTYLYQKSNRSKGYGYHLQQLKLLPLPYRSINGAIQVRH